MYYPQCINVATYGVVSPILGAPIEENKGENFSYSSTTCQVYAWQRLIFSISPQLFLQVLEIYVCS